MKRKSTASSSHSHQIEREARTDINKLEAYTAQQLPSRGIEYELFDTLALQQPPQQQGVVSVKRKDSDDEFAHGKVDPSEAGCKGGSS